MPSFIPGLQLSELYYWEAVRPILSRNFHNLPHSAALIGYGSDVLGFDTLVSRDHMWGPRLILFLTEKDFENKKLEVDLVLRIQLPVCFKGYSTHFGKPNLADNGTRLSMDIEKGPVDHLIEIETISSFWQRTAKIDPYQEPTATDWLTIPQQQLIEWTSGKVFYDGLGLEAVRSRFAWYPHDIWLYLLASQWAQLAEIESFVGRTWQVGDKLGSQLIVTQVVETIIHLCFLMERKYTPYAKWLGTAFERLQCSVNMQSLLEGILSSPEYSQTEPLLVKAYTILAKMHNELKITPWVDPTTRTYSGWHAFNAGEGELSMDDAKNTRPHQVLFAGRFVGAIRAQIQDPGVLALKPNIGSVSQFLRESSPAIQSSSFCRDLVDDLQA